ncbi:protein of unknown function [Acidithiobacillus ferrivorans]|uniref:Uncharacterized protein n=1 Tax=Acidithiobacillus ferrivorans TaxID=160808 RepID=A0ABY1MMB1_9PROT|nr:protein of unknown function [Acidithiobacillus ferrivorans]
MGRSLTAALSLTGFPAQMDDHLAEVPLYSIREVLIWALKNQRWCGTNFSSLIISGTRHS